jgi:hypothetical protein
MGQGTFGTGLLDICEVGQDNLCHDGNALPVCESGACMNAAVALEFDPGQFPEADGFGRRRLQKVALPAVAEGRKALRNHIDAEYSNSAPVYRPAAPCCDLHSGSGESPSVGDKPTFRTTSDKRLIGSRRDPASFVPPAGVADLGDFLKITVGLRFQN